MKILIDGRLYGLENAGLGRYIMSLVTELSKIDNKNRYILLLTKKYASKVVLPENWKIVTANFRHYSFFEQFFLPKIIKEEKPDITHFPHFNVPIFFKGNFVVTVHDLLMHKQTGLAATTLIPPMYFLKRTAYKSVFRYAVMRSKRIIVPSIAVQEEVQKYYGIDDKKIDVVYEGFEEKNIEKKIVFDPKKYGLGSLYISYVGNAYPHKNLKRLIEAVVLYNENSGRNLTLALASARNQFTKRLEKTIVELGAQKYVKMVGFVPDEQLPDFLRKSVGLFTPSLSEGFGLPGLEAMSFGTFVAASEIPVYKEIYKDNALYFNPFDFTSIENAISRVVNMNQKDKIDRIKKSEEFIKRYSWKKAAQETLLVYEKAYGNSLPQSRNQT